MEPQVEFEAWFLLNINGLGFCGLPEEFDFIPGFLSNASGEHVGCQELRVATLLGAGVEPINVVQLLLCRRRSLLLAESACLHSGRAAHIPLKSWWVARLPIKGT